VNYQKGIDTNGGDVAGRDIDKRQFHFNDKDSAIFLMPFLEIVKNIENGYEIDIEEQLDDLNHYSGTVRSDARGLEKKLQDSGREYIIEKAIRYKNKASRLIAKHQDSPAFQFLISKVLARIEVAFDSLIRPMIQNESCIKDIEAAIYNDVVLPIEKLLINTPLGGNSECVLHLLYFLAGNCHICWDKKC